MPPTLHRCPMAHTLQIAPLLPHPDALCLTQCTAVAQAPFPKPQAPFVFPKPQASHTAPRASLTGMPHSHSLTYHALTHCPPHYVYVCHIACATLLMVHSARATLCLCYTLPVLHSACATLCLCYTLLVLHSACATLCLWHRSVRAATHARHRQRQSVVTLSNSGISKAMALR